GTLAAAMGLADVNPVAKACALTPASGYTSLTPCVADAPPPCRPGAFPELSCNQSACPAGMYDQTYTYGVSGTVTESSCNTSTFKTKTCSLSCPPAPKPVGCDVYKIEFRHSYPGMGNISGDAPACLRNTWNSYTNFGTGHPFSDDYFFTYYYQDMDPIQNSDVRNCVGTIRSKIKTYTWIDNNCKVIASSVSNLDTELPNYRPHDYLWQLSAYGNYDKIAEASVYPCTSSINRQRVGWNPTQRELRALAERMALADNTAAREVAAMLKTRGRVCEGTLLILFSPISLIWDESLKIEDTFTLSTFPLNPDAPAGQTYEWRGSAKAPLLVWDEKGDGVITTAAQLFGNHTFGKRWPDGYTALHSLDSDKNGSVSGDELKHIRVWFDDNANGVSEPGEVKDLAAVDVTALYTVPDRKDMKTGFIHAKRGYDRVVDGKKVTLPSVDWAAKAYKTPSDVSNGTKTPAAAGGVPASDGGGATPASSSAPGGAATGSSSGKSSAASSGSGSGGSAGGASGSGAGGGSSGGGSGAGGGGGGGSGGGAAPTTSSKSALGGSSTAKTVAMDIAGIWQIAYAPIDGADDPLGISGISFVPGAYWNELSGFVFNPYDPLYGDTEEFETQRAIYEKQFPNLPLQPNTPEGLSTLRDIFLKGLNAVKPGTNPDASKWGSKSSLVGSYSGKETYIFSEIDPLTEQQTLYTLTFTDGTGTFKGTMTAQIPGRGQLKRDFTGKRLQVYKQ
ncbi:MAG: hypothetical protein ACK5XX_00265, partial [Holosporales bacterium]